jgi:hypothetical protein
VQKSSAVRFRDRVSHLNGNLDRAPHVHLPSGDLATQRLALQELERQIDTPSCSPTSNSVIAFGARAASARAPVSISCRSPRRRRRIGGKQPQRHSAAVRVSRARYRSPDRRLETFEQVVVRDDADGRSGQSRYGRGYALVWRDDALQQLLRVA